MVPFSVSWQVSRVTRVSVWEFLIRCGESESDLHDITVSVFCFWHKSYILLMLQHMFTELTLYPQEWLHPVRLLDALLCEGVSIFGWTFRHACAMEIGILHIHYAIRNTAFAMDNCHTTMTSWRYYASLALNRREVRPADLRSFLQFAGWSDIEEDVEAAARPYLTGVWFCVLYVPLDTCR